MQMEITNQQICECLDNVNNSDLIIEVGKNQPHVLKLVDRQFGILRKHVTARTINNMAKLISEFTHIKKVRFIVGNDNDAYMIPYYNNSLPKFLKHNVLSKDNIDEMQSIDSKFINILYIHIGSGLFKYFTDSQMTAILLHEIGHAYQHTSNLPSIIHGLVNYVTGSSLVTKLLSLPFFISAIAISVPLTMLFFLVTRTLSFAEHLGEYNADKFTAKYGYGDEIIYVLKFFHTNNLEHKQHKLIHLIKKFVTIFFIPNSHPTNSKRICNMINVIKKDYIKQYPNFSKELNIILSDVKC